jgi:hypothetical protein
MTKERFTELRESNPSQGDEFLFAYFCEEKAVQPDFMLFQENLNAWLMLVNRVHPMDGRKIILNFLDGKFASN